MSDASLRRDWRLWEGGRDEDALRRYVVAVCREAPPTPDFRPLDELKAWARVIDTDSMGLAEWISRAGAKTLRREVAAPVRRLTVCGPWLPSGIKGWLWRLWGPGFPTNFEEFGRTNWSQALAYMDAIRETERVTADMWRMSAISQYRGEPIVQDP